MSSPVDPWSGPPEHSAQPSYPPPVPPLPTARHGRPEHAEPRPDGWTPAHPPEPAPTRPSWSDTPAGRRPPTAPWQRAPDTPEPSRPGWSAPPHRPTTMDAPTQVYAAIPPISPAEPDSTGHPRRPDDPVDQAVPSGVDTPPPGRRSRRPLLLSLAVAGLLVLTLGGLAYVNRAGDDDPSPPPVAASPTPPPTPTPEPVDSAEPTPSAEPSPDPQIRLVAPKSLGGRARSSEPELRALADELVKDLKAKVRSGNSTIGAFYGSFEDEDIVMVAGASGLVLDPKQELDDTVKALASELNVRRMSTVSAGPLGGVAKCGDGSASNVSLGVCAWADQGSVGMIVMFSTSASKAKSEFVKIRAEVEKRS